MGNSSRSGNGAEKGGIAEGFEGSEAEDLAAFEVAEIFAAGGIEIAVEELEAMDLAVGTATRAESLAFGVRGRADDAGAERRRGRRGFGRKNE